MEKYKNTIAHIKAGDGVGNGADLWRSNELIRKHLLILKIQGSALV